MITERLTQSVEKELELRDKESRAHFLELTRMLEELRKQGLITPRKYALPSLDESERAFWSNLARQNY